VNREEQTLDEEELGDLLKSLGVEPSVYSREVAGVGLITKELEDVPFVEDMIWEVDEDGDGSVSLEELHLAYSRTAADRTGYEPRKLMTLVDFVLMDTEEEGFINENKIVDFMLLRYDLRHDDPVVQAMLDQRHRAGDAAKMDPNAHHIHYPEYVRRVAAAVRTQRRRSNRRRAL
jgi:hypothetical protein